MDKAIEWLRYVIEWWQGGAGGLGWEVQSQVLAV